jgi:photosystem II stability/assembly factor-like uncharacterized protein
VIGSRFGAAALAVVLATFAGLPALGAVLDLNDVDALSWRFIGPFRGGRVLTVTGIPSDARTFYFGAVNGGVWKTQDAGRTWQPIFDSEPTGSIGAIAVAPSAPATLYVGTGEADMRSDIAHGDGIYKSTDAGQHWSHIGLEDSRQIGRILVDPHNANVVFAAALGHAYGANSVRGVYRTRDGGAHWVRVLSKDENTGAIDLAFKPGDPKTIYAALWQTRRPPWSVYPPSSGPGSGLCVSHDGGDHWRQISGNGFPAHPGRMGIALSSANPKRIFVLVDGPKEEGGLYRSDDGGNHWSHTSSDKRIWDRGWYFNRLTVDPTNADRVYVMDTIVLRSDDGGRAFNALKGDPTGDDFHDLWIDPTNRDRQILGSDQGAQITLNGGRTWSSWYNQPTAQIYHVSVDNRFPYWVYGAQQDSGAAAVPSRSDSSDGITVEQFREITAGGESGMIAPDPDDPDSVYGGTVDKLDLRTQQTRSFDPTLAYPGESWRGAWTLPLAFSQSGPKELYFGRQELFRTADGGLHWDKISPDLTRPDPGIPSNLDASAAADDDHGGPRRGVIYAIAPSSLKPGMLWVGTDDGQVWRSDDDGGHWANVTPQGMPAWSKVAGIEAGHHNPDMAYIAIDRHRLDDDAPYILRTTDGGRSWTKIVAGIPADRSVNVVREDPVAAGVLYAGTEKGIYVSLDDGANWLSLQRNLPVTSVRDLVIHGDDLVIATHGRGFWIMDDAALLRQLGSAESGVTLFAPATALRVRVPDFTGTPLPNDEPKAANPPAGAIIDYRLPAGITGAVGLTIYDDAQNVVRSFASTDAAPIAKPGQDGFAPEWMPKAFVLNAAPGLHRFVWNLHCAKSEALADPGIPAVWVPPGRYWVELKAGGHTVRQPLAVLPDPRVHLSPEAFQKEYALAAKVEAVLADVVRAQTEATALFGHLSERLAASGAARDAVSALRTKVGGLAGIPLTDNPYASFDSPSIRPDDLRTLGGNLDRLLAAVDGADAEPGPDTQASFAELSRLSSATLDAWRTLKSGELAALNARLAVEHVKAVTF